MAPAPTASGATRGSSETDELLVKDASASRGADVRDVDGRGSSAARTAVRVAAVGACALVGVAAVSGDVFGHFAGVAAFGGSDDRARLGESHEGRWATAFDLADDSAFSLRDGKRGAWGAARGVSGAAPQATPLSASAETRRAGSIPSLRSAPALPAKKPSRFQKWERAPYEYEMPAAFSSLGDGDGDESGIPGEPRDRTRLGAARERSLRDRRFDAAALGDAPVDRPKANNDSGDASNDASSDDDSDTSETSETYEYEENYDNDGSVSWDVAYAPPPKPPAPSAPSAPPRPRRPTSDEVAAIGKASAGTSTYYPYHDRVVRAGAWGDRSTPASANDGALKPREPDAAAAKAAEAARAKRRADEERWRRLEADGGENATTTDDASSPETETKTETTDAEKVARTKRGKRGKGLFADAARQENARARGTARGGDYDDAWLGDVRAKKTMNRAEKKAAAVSSEREFREAFVGADYDDASALLNARPREKRDKEMTEQEVAAARAGGLMASLGADAYPRADVESYEADLAAGRAFASPEEEARAKAQAKARYEAEAARLETLERALNEDGSIQWDAPRDVREVLEALLATEKGGVVSNRRFDSRKTSPEGSEGRPRPSSQPRAVNPDGSVPWDAPEVPTYVFNEELRSRLGVEEGAESALAWDEKPEAELVSSFVSAAGGDADDPQDSDEGAVAWTDAFDADASAGDGALDEARRAEEAYDPAQSDHYLDDLLRPSDELLANGGVFGDEVAVTGLGLRRSSRNERSNDAGHAGDVDDGSTVSWNDADAWRSAVTGEAPERGDERAEPNEDESEEDAEEEDGDEEKTPKRDVEFDTRDYDVGALGARTRADPRLEPQSYEDELAPMDDHERTFRAAALGDAMLATSRDAIPLKDATETEASTAPTLLFRSDEAEAEEATRKEIPEEKPSFGTPKCEQQSARHDGGPHRDESLCQKYEGDDRSCQTFVAPTQSCWHKTVGGAFLDPASARPGLGARGGAGPLTGREDPEANAQWRKEFYDCMAGDPKYTGAVEAPYRLPRSEASLQKARDARSVGDEKQRKTVDVAASGALTRKFFAATRPGTAYFYHFVHVPKAGGTYFKSLLHASETRRQARLGGPDPRWDQALVQTWNTKPLVDMTEASFANVAWRYVEGGKRGAAIQRLAQERAGRENVPPEANETGARFSAFLGDAERDADAELGASTATPQFTGPGMRASYEGGYRAVSKGSLSMGACDMVDAPCAYLTVLRDPWEKFMSFYQYACLEGSENMGAWTEEWRNEAQSKGYLETGCPASPTQFYRDVGGMVEVLAPGAAPDSHCAVEAAKRNLASPCMRFLLLEDLEGGLKHMRESLPDFADIGAEHAAGANDAAAAAQAKAENARRNGSRARMDDAKTKRLDAYKRDEREMRELRRLMAGELEVYRFAKEERYETQWEEPLRTC